MSAATKAKAADVPAYVSAFCAHSRRHDLCRGLGICSCGCHLPPPTCPTCGQTVPQPLIPQEP